MVSDDIPPQPGETHRQYARRVTAALGAPAAPTVVLTPDSKISLTIWKVGSIVGLLVGGAWVARGAYESIQDAIRRLDERLAVVAAAVSTTDPARVRDECRKVVGQELRSLVIECPRPTRKGESVGPCKIVFPIRERGETP